MKIQRVNRYDLCDVEFYEKIPSWEIIKAVDFRTELDQAKPNEAFIARFKGFSSVSIIWKEEGTIYRIRATDYPKLLHGDVSQFFELLSAGLSVRDAISFMTL